MNVGNKLSIAVIVVALAMAFYHMISAQVFLQATIAHLNTHLAFCLFLVFLAGAAGSKAGIRRLWCLVLALLALLATGYVQVLWPELQMRAYFNTPTDLVIGTLLIILVLEATRREFGLMLPLLTIIVVLYPFIGYLLPEPLYCHSLGLTRTISNLSIGLAAGIYGRVLPVSANFIFLFVLFGGILRATGGTAFFLQLARLAAGKLQGGPGIMAVVSSATVGSIIGSAAANVAITGSFTIPLMKKVGYKPEQAAGIEAAASNGGQIMPPIMGLVAFGMAGLTGIPYINIIVMAVLPAILYFFCAGAYVYLRAGQLKIGRMVGEKVEIRELLLSAPSFLVPFTVIIVLLVMGYSVMYVAFWAIISSILVCLIRKKRPSLGQFINGFAEGARAGAGIGASAACVGLIMATFTMSGLGIKLASGIEVWSGGDLLPALLIIWAMCVLLGFGGVSLTAYIIVSIFAVSALLKMGVPFEIAHFFVMFVAVFAFITPPIAVVALIAGRLAGATYIKSAIEATKVAAAGFLLPLMFVYCPILLLRPQQPLWEVIGVLACITSLLALQVGFVGYYMRECRLWERILAIVAGALLLAFLPLQSYVWFAAGMTLFALLTLLQWRKRGLPERLGVSQAINLHK